MNLLGAKLAGVISHDEIGVALATLLQRVKTSVPQQLTRALDTFLYGTFLGNPMAAESKVDLEEWRPFSKGQEGNRCFS